MADREESSLSIHTMQVGAIPAHMEVSFPVDAPRDHPGQDDKLSPAAADQSEIKDFAETTARIKKAGKTREKHRRWPGRKKKKGGHGETEPEPSSKPKPTTLDRSIEMEALCGCELPEDEEESYELGKNPMPAIVRKETLDQGHASDQHADKPPPASEGEGARKEEIFERKEVDQLATQRPQSPPGLPVGAAGLPRDAWPVPAQTDTGVERTRSPPPQTSASPSPCSPVMPFSPVPDPRHPARSLSPPPDQPGPSQATSARPPAEDIPLPRGGDNVTPSSRVGPITPGCQSAHAPSHMTPTSPVMTRDRVLSPHSAAIPTHAAATKHKGKLTKRSQNQNQARIRYLRDLDDLQEHMQKRSSVMECGAGWYDGAPVKKLACTTRK